MGQQRRARCPEAWRPSEGRPLRGAEDTTRDPVESQSDAQPPAGAESDKPLGAALLLRKPEPEAGRLRMVSTRLPTKVRCVMGEGHS